MGHLAANESKIKAFPCVKAYNICLITFNELLATETVFLNKLLLLLNHLESAEL